MDNTWGANPFAENSWASFSAADPLGRAGSFSNQYSMPSVYSYDQRQSSSGSMAYEPSFGRCAANYDPISGFTSRVIDSDIQSWMQREHPDLFNFDTGMVNDFGGQAGDVARDAALGQFAQTPGSWDKIQAAANQAGIPANVLLSFVHMESSGDWNRDGNRLWMGRPRSGGLLPYIGVFDATLKSRLGPNYSVESLLGDQQGQLNVAAQILSQMYGEVKSANPNYDWNNVASYYFSGHMDPVSNPWGDEHGNYGGNAGYMNTFMSVLDRANNWTISNGGVLGQVGGGSGIGNINNEDWAPYNAQSNLINRIAQASGVEPNLAKAVFRASDGTGRDPGDAAASMAHHFSRSGSWEAAAKQYASDSGINPDSYWRHVNNYWQELDASASGMFGGAGSDVGPVTNIEAIWGGIGGVNITQRNGERNSWTAGAGAGYYGYSSSVLGYSGAHPGNDYGMEYGTQIFTPVGGTVTIVGSGSYNDERQMGVPGTGELRIRLDNGDDLILGHMAGIHVSVGDRVQPGQRVGVSGTAGSGAHLHLEYRTPDSSMSSGWRSLDPEEALRGAFTGSFSGQTQGAGISRPMTYGEMLRAAASGQQIRGGATVANTSNTWNSFLQRAASGQVQGNYMRQMAGSSLGQQAGSSIANSMRNAFGGF